ncbi:hypothetical protein Tco_0678381 [Tanacetum coccineum]|uniref:Uncharacterized protein n=1 Tax=Tanacetum coccineum TaxID=301880 RepID=A0ABQ4XFH3_9ASTR
MEMTMISKDGEISKFPGDEFAPHRLPQQEGNMNGLLIEEEDEPVEYKASDKDVDSDLESTFAQPGNQNGYNAVQDIGNQVVQNAVQNPAWAKGNGNGNNGDLEENEEVNTSCILMANLQQASSSGTQADKALVYDSDGSVEVHQSKNYYNNEIFNMFAQEEQYIKLLEPITEPHLVHQNNNNVILGDPNVEHSGGIVDQNPTTIEETRAYFESLYNNLIIKVEKVNMVNHKMKEKNDDLTTKLARYKGQENVLKSIKKNMINLKGVIKNKHDPPAVYDSEETLQLAQESHLKMKQLNKEIKPANYAKINQLSEVFVSQKANSREELYFSNTSNTASVSNSVSKPISIPDDEFSDNASSPSVARNFLNEVKGTIVTLQRVVKQKMIIDINNWSSPVHQEFQKIIKDEIAPIVNQVDDRVQNFEIQFLKEASKFVRD